MYNNEILSLLELLLIQDLLYFRKLHSHLFKKKPGNHFFLKFIYLFIYLFIYFWLCWVFVSVQGLSLVVARGGHSSSRCMGLSLSRPLLSRSTGSRRAGSVVVAHRPSCSVACGILPDQGSNLCPLHWQADSQPLRHQGSPEITLDRSFSLMFGIFLQCAGPGRHSSHHIGIASVYIFLNAMVTNAAANSVSGIYIAITASLMPQQCLLTPSAPMLPMCHPLYVP